MKTANGEARATALQLYDAALAAVDPRQAVKRALVIEPGRLLVNGTPVPFTGAIDVVAIGKAAGAMAAGAVDVLGESAGIGFVLTKEGHNVVALPERFKLFEAGHPIPDERGIAATREILQHLRQLTPADTVMFLISGGGSSLLELPREPLTLADLSAVTQQLLLAGAPIQDLNAVRSCLSQVKGGGLRSATASARTITLIVSDVLGDDAAVIASGPTITSNLNVANALNILRRYGLEETVPVAVRNYLLQMGDGKQAAVTGRMDSVDIIASNSMALEAVAAEARRLGLNAHVAWRGMEGEAEELGRAWVELLQSADPGIDLLVGGGEATVTVEGSGSGGRNTEFALAAASGMAEQEVTGWTIASLGTDGQDALTGAAGAMVNERTLARIAGLHLDPLQALRDNDSATLLAKTGDLVVTGPSGTNVADLYLAVRQRLDPGMSA